MLDLKEEIRINSTYAHLYKSEYLKSEQEESLPKINKKMLLTQDYLRRITSGFGVPSTSILPPNCRYLERLDRGYLAIIEEPPAFRTIKIYLDFRKEVLKLKSKGLLEKYGYDERFGFTDTDNYKPESFNLALPYVIFIFYINEYNQVSHGQIFFRVARLTGIADYLLKVPFTNISENQYICFGSGINRSEKSLNAAVENTISTFWNTEFNSDYTYNYKAYSNIAGVNSFMEWQALSQINPMFIYNVEWIKLPMNINQALMEIKRHYKLTTKNDIQYQNLSNLFSSPFDTGKDELLTPTSKIKQRLYYDVAEGIYLDSRFFIHVHDAFTIKHGKQTCYINSFISFMESEKIKYIRVEREDGRLITYKYTKALSKYILESCKQLRYEKTGVLKNGVVIKEDDILVMKDNNGNPFYTRVGFVRKTKEGFHEGRFSDGFYILENTEATMFNIENPNYLNFKLNKNQIYAFSRSSSSGVPFNIVVISKFDRVDANSKGLLSVYFKDIRNQDREYSFRLDESDQVKIFYSMDQLKPLPPVFRIGRQLKAVVDNNSKLASEPVVFGSDSGVLYDESIYSIIKPKVNFIREYLLSEDKFHVKGFDMDIEFSIGDKVVTADWDKPINMLSIKVIQGFTFNESNGDIHFILIDREGKLHQVLYVQDCAEIFVGRIRKICNSFGKLTAGTKIISREAGIPHFPKKDVNIIIGFITDTGGPDPLVLCSNCCTLWYSDVIKSFQKITMKAKKWVKLQHAPIDVSKIKYQPGDVIIGKNEYLNRLGWLVFKSRGFTSSKIIDLKYYSTYCEYYSLDRYVTANSKLDCIPNPRVNPKMQAELGYINCWPNLHGHYFTCELSSLCFINDERSIINVQSRPK